MTDGQFGPSGGLGIQVIRPVAFDRLPSVRAPLSWHIRNTLRRSFLKGWFAFHVVRPIANAFGVTTIMSELRAQLIHPDGRVIDYGVLSYRVITDAGVAFLVDDWDNDATDITLMHFHACGTGAVGEAVGDTALGAESTTITDRATGTESQPTAPQLRTIGTQSFTGGGAITEHGIFSVVTESAGVLWDRSVFAAINVVNLDSIQWTYTCTITSGG